MKHHTIKAVLLAISLLLSASLTLAAENNSAAPGEAKAVGKSPTNPKSAVAKNAKAAPKVKLVDINGAGKKELQTLPGISEADADKIIAGRPYGSKAHLTTRNIVSREVYENLKTLVIAKQKQTAAAKPSGK